MAILAFQKPDKVLMLEADAVFGKFEFRPLEPGYGITIGNALRRILLSSLEGYAISSIKIEGVEHEFATIPGVLEDVTNIILNLKQVRFKYEEDDVDEEKVTVSVSKKEVFKAGDIGKQLTGGFEVLNPDLEICHLDPDASFQIELVINRGRGYVPADEHATSPDLHVISIDSIYTPIRNVKYTIDNYRVEQKTDYEKLILEITTDGSIHPKDALREAAKILICHFMLFSDEKITVETVEDVESSEDFDEEILHMRQLLKTKLLEMDLSVRALNCLKAADVETLGELVHYNKNDLLKFRNFGKKSLTELDELLDGLHLSFGMDISKYKLDKE
jgi:DNA-directed RNA polymerase subunit alpha